MPKNDGFDLQAFYDRLDGRYDPHAVKIIKNMQKSWDIFTWILILLAQTAAGYFLVLLTRVFIDYSQATTIARFLIIPLSIWLSYSIAVYGIGMLGLWVKKKKPTVAVLRLITTTTLASVPMLMQVFNGVSVGVEDWQQFHDLVIGRMVPYYTQLCAAFALVGFFVTIWWHKATLNAAPKSTGKSAGKTDSKKAKR